MALVEARRPLNMLDTEVLDGALTEASATTIEITSGAKVGRYTGDFTYDNFGNIFGQIRGYETLENGTLTGSVSGFSVDAQKFLGLLSAEDVDGIYELILARGDRFEGSSGRDQLLGFNGADRMEGNGGRDDLYGGKGKDSLNGDDGNDKLFGEEGNDVLEAGKGGDKLIGGAGADRLVGGTDSARDTFIFEAASDSRTKAQDTIENFSRNLDRLDLRGTDADESTGGDERFLWAGKNADAHSVWWTDSGKGVVLSADVNGDRGADLKILLAGIHSIGESDLLL